MPVPAISDAEFIELFERLKSPAKIAKFLGVNERCVYARRNRLQLKHSIPLQSNARFNNKIAKQNFRCILKNIEGVVLVFSDVHAWHDYNTIGFQALLYLIKKLKPQVIVCNGDLFDGCSISRFARSGIMDDQMPSVAEELSYSQELMAQIERAAPDDCNLVYTYGNHDVRFTGRLTQVAPEFSGLSGFSLNDYFKNWKMSWSCVINPNTKSETWIKHRWHQGAITAGYQNVLKAGGSVHMVTSHTHALEVKPFVNIRGERYYGVQTGTLSPIGNDTQKFGYAEDSPSQSAIGFCVLTYSDGYLLPPELVECVGGRMYYRGEPIPNEPNEPPKKRPRKK